MKVEFDLLAEVACLLKKYGPEAFEELANYLKDPKAVEHLVAILSTSAHAAKRRPSSVRGPQRKTRRKAGIRELLFELERIEPQKAQ